jgi:hypothetical protein
LLDILLVISLLVIAIFLIIYILYSI